MSNTITPYTYRHFRLPDVDGPAITALFKRVESPAYVGGGEYAVTFEAAWSLCSPEDNFSRATGREIAERRMKSGETVVCIAICRGGSPSRQEYLDALAEGIAVALHVQADKFMMDTLDAIDFYFLHEGTQADIEHMRYASSLSWPKRLYMKLLESPVVRKIMEIIN